MTLNYAFQSLAIEQVEKALTVDAVHGFPQDVFGLARLLLRTFSVLDAGCVVPSDAISEPLETDRVIEQRIADMLELEGINADQFEDAATVVGWHSDTRH